MSKAKEKKKNKTIEHFTRRKRIGHYVSKGKKLNSVMQPGQALYNKQYKHNNENKR